MEGSNQFNRSSRLCSSLLFRLTLFLKCQGEPWKNLGVPCTTSSGHPKAPSGNNSGSADPSSLCRSISSSPSASYSRTNRYDTVNFVTNLKFVWNLIEKSCFEGYGKRRVQLPHLPNVDSLHSRLGSNGILQNALAASGVSADENDAVFVDLCIRRRHVIRHGPRQYESKA